MYPCPRVIEMLKSLWWKSRKTYRHL
jgi:hypothetical protein